MRYFEQGLIVITVCHPGFLKNLNRFAQHVLGYLFHGKLSDRPLGHKVTVPQDGKLIAECKDFLHLVRNKNHRQTFVSQSADEFVEDRLLCLGQTGRRFVQKDDLRIGVNAFGDLNQLLSGQ